MPDSTAPETPRTEAGRDLLRSMKLRRSFGTVEDILAIEREAAAPSAEALDVERLARSFPNVMDQATCDEVFGPGHNPIDLTDEWFMTARELAEHVAAEYARLATPDTDR